MSQSVVPLTAGPELDRWIAEHVKGWTPCRNLNFKGEEELIFLEDYTSQPWAHREFQPSTTIADAWRVMEHMDRRCLGVKRGLLHEAGTPGGVPCWLCTVTYLSGPTRQETLYRAQASTAPLAICLAARHLHEQTA